MILCFNCPICGEVHRMLLTQSIINEHKFQTICSKSGRLIHAEIFIKFKIVPDVSKLDLAVAEEEAKLEKAKWALEEANKLEFDVNLKKKREENK